MRDRAQERYGLLIDKRTRRELVLRVRNNQITHSLPAGRTRSVIIANHRDIEVTFVYSHLRNDIVTFLPADCVETAAWRSGRAHANSHCR